jgi:hypothetical protein
MTRRYFFQECGMGVGVMALAALLNDNRICAAPPLPAATDPQTPRPPHRAPRAKRVIYLFMAGGPSQLDMFDYKPALQKHDGQPIPPEVVKDQRYAFIERSAKILSPQFKFARHGKSGAMLSEVLPHLAEIVDDISIVKSVTTDAFNHAPAQIFMNTGHQQFGRPSFGAWTLYGVGSEGQELPGSVVLTSAKGPCGGASNYGSGCRPTT